MSFLHWKRVINTPPFRLPDRRDPKLSDATFIVDLKRILNSFFAVNNRDRCRPVCVCMNSDAVLDCVGVDDDYLRKLRSDSVRNVKATNGLLSFEQKVRDYEDMETDAQWQD